jgi:hypothetical protein
MKYKPKMAYGGWIGLLLGLLVFGFTIWGIDFALGENDRTLKLLLNIPTYLFIFIYTYLILGAFNLNYKIEKDAMLIIWGLQKKRIEWDQFEEIINIQGRANLLPFLAVSWPGYMVGLYSAKGIGSVRMYATHTEDGFIYLKTKKGFFGISPEDQGFINAIINKTAKNLKTVDMTKMPAEEKGESIHEDRIFNLYYKLNIIFLFVFAAYLAIFFPGSGAPKFIVLLLVLALALFIFNGANAKRLYQFSSQGAYITLLVGLAVTGIFFILSFAGISL